MDTVLAVMIIVGFGAIVLINVRWIVLPFRCAVFLHKWRPYNNRQRCICCGYQSLGKDKKESVCEDP